MPGNNAALEALELIFDQNLNGDGKLTTTVIQPDTSSFGTTKLTEVADQVSSAYYLDGSSGSGPMLKVGGVPVYAGEFGAFVPFGAVKTATGYDVALEAPRANKYTVWSTDSNGNYLSNIIGTVPGNSTALESLETTFHHDLNSDGVIGVVTTPIQTDGSTSLVEVGNKYDLDSTSSGVGPVLKVGGTPVYAGEFGAFVPFGAVKTATGYDVALEAPRANEYTVWSTDSKGNYLSNIIGTVSGNSAAL